MVPHLVFGKDEETTSALEGCDFFLWGRSEGEAREGALIDADRIRKKERERREHWRRRGRSLSFPSPPNFELTASETAHPELLLVVDDRRGGSRRGERGEGGGFREEEDVDVDGDAADSATNAPWRGFAEAGRAAAASPTGLAAAARWLHAERLVAMTRRGQEVTRNSKKEGERKREGTSEVNFYIGKMGFGVRRLSKATSTSTNEIYFRNHGISFSHSHTRQAKHARGKSDSL